VSLWSDWFETFSFVCRIKTEEAGTWKFSSLSSFSLHFFLAVCLRFFLFLSLFLDKITETVAKDAHFFINRELGHHLPIIQLVTFLE